jgi:phosphoglycolate phosphatase
MACDVLLFDLDGTLVDSAPDLQAAINALLRELGRPPLAIEQVRRMIGDGAPKLVERALAAAGAPDAPLAPCLDRFLGFYEAEPTARTRVHPGVRETLDRLFRDGYRMAICTNKPERATRLVLSDLGIDGPFTVVIGGDTLPVRKPDPRHLLGALRALGRTDPGAAVMIGDNENDAAAARAAGLRLILMRYGYARVPLAEIGADIELDRFDQLPDALERLRTR